MGFFKPLKKLVDWIGGAKDEEKPAVKDSGALNRLFDLQQEDEASNGDCLVISSNSQIGRPFAGEYVEQAIKVNDRVVYKKLAAPAGQSVYLLFNEAGQWALTPHMDGRPDGWAFASDEAAEPGDIKGDFQLWTGTSWVADPTLKVMGPGATGGTFEALAKEPEALKDEAASEAPVLEEVHEEENAQPPLVATTALPREVEPLAQLHWKAQLHHGKRALVDWPTCEQSAALSDRQLEEHPGVKRGVLPNGMRYVILRNAMPPQRLEAHIEIHVGSVDEEAHEQGIAHMMEHVCFLGSRKREALIGTGTRSNALTDFQHTIYHVHAPVARQNGSSMYVPVLEALHEIAFAPEMLTTRIEKERKAVLAEMQQVNDMEYRLETWTLSQLHETCNLGSQFPIGKEEQIKGWQKKDLRAFHDKWYYPGNTTLYVVGDLPEEEMIKGIEKVFSSTPAKNEITPGVSAHEPTWGPGSSDVMSLNRRKIAKKRPEMLHNMTVPMIGTQGMYSGAMAFEAPQHGPVKIFRNELLEGLQMNFYGKAPVRPLRTLEDIRFLVAVRVLIGVLQFRIVTRFASNHAPVTIDHSDSFREGCAITSIQINADPRDWRTSLLCVVQEVRAVCDYGVTEGELKRYISAMMKDVEKGVIENDSVPSEDHLNFIMTSDVFDHVVLHPDQSYKAFSEVVPHVTGEDIKATAKWVLGFLGYYGMSLAPPPTAIVVATPTKVFDEAMQTWVDFDITPDEVVDLLTTVPDKSEEEAMNQVEVPEHLITHQLDAWLAENPVDVFTAWRAVNRKYDEQTGITQLRLPNGAKVNYASTVNESQGSMRIFVPGGRGLDTKELPGATAVGVRTISESGAVSNYERQQIELFAVSNLMSVHLDLNQEFSFIDSTFQLSGNENGYLELLHLLFQEPRWELPAFIRAQQAYKGQDLSFSKSLELSTMHRLKKMMFPADTRITEYTAEEINRLTLAKVREAFNGQFRPQDLEVNLVADFEGRKSHKVDVEGAMSTGKHREDGESLLEVPEEVIERRLQELDGALWKYFGSIPASEKTRTEETWPICMQAGEALKQEERYVIAHLEDSDERAMANLGGGAANRWGKGDAVHSAAMEKINFSWANSKSDFKDHPLFPSVCQMALREVLNTRLFSMVRDRLGLSYDCTFELSMLDRLEAGWYTCTVSAHPSRIMEAVEAAKVVITSAKKQPISEFEVRSAKNTLLRRHEVDLQKNEYWIGLLANLQCDDVPKDLSCIADLQKLLEGITWLDVNNAYKTLLTDDDQIFISVCTAGPGASWVQGGAMGASTATSDTIETSETSDLKILS